MAWNCPACGARRQAERNRICGNCGQPRPAIAPAIPPVAARPTQPQRRVRTQPHTPSEAQAINQATAELQRATQEAREAAHALHEAHQLSPAPAEPPQPTTAAPTKPSGLRAIAGDTNIELHWDNIPNVAEYHVYRRTRNSQYGRVGVVPVGTTYVDLNLTNGETYTYTVQAINRSGEYSANSDPVSATPMAATPIIAEKKEEESPLDKFWKLGDFRNIGKKRS